MAGLTKTFLTEEMKPVFSLLTFGLLMTHSCLHCHILLSRIYAQLAGIIAGIYKGKTGLNQVEQLCHPGEFRASVLFHLIRGMKYSWAAHVSLFRL